MTCKKIDEHKPLSMNIERIQHICKKIVTSKQILRYMDGSKDMNRMIMTSKDMAGK